MELESHADRNNRADDRGNLDALPGLPEQQFTLRDLRLALRLVWILVAIGFAVARYWIVAAIFALILLPTFFVGDWLIRPTNRSALAFVVAGSWIMLGCGLAIGAFALIYHPIAKQTGALGWIIAASLTLAATVCFVIAAKRWRGVSNQRRANL
jgi:hypothetical protein